MMNDRQPQQLLTSDVDAVRDARAEEVTLSAVVVGVPRGNITGEALEELILAMRDAEASGDDRTPVNITPETRDTSPPPPRTASRTRRRGSPPCRVMKKV